MDPSKKRRIPRGNPSWRQNRFDPQETPRQSHVQQTLGTKIPVIAATDYVRAVPQMIAQHLSQRFIALGTDGFGRSDQRANLRAFFEVDRQHIALAAIEALVQEGMIDSAVHKEALEQFSLSQSKQSPWTV